MDANYYEFKSEEESEKWVNENYNEFISDTHKNSCIQGTLGCALFSYTGSMSKDYNNILKFNNGSITNVDNMIDEYYNANDNNGNEDSFNSFWAIDAKKDIKLIYEAFKKNYIKENIILFHYFNKSNFDNDLFKKDEFEIKHFISTTMIKKSDGIIKLIKEKKYNSILVIKVKQGTQCIPIGNNENSTLKEYEIILKPNSQFKIKKVQKKILRKIKYIIECELIK